MHKTALVLLLTLFSSASLVAQDNILGTWLTENKKAIVEIYKKGDSYFGKIISLDPATNPDGSPILDKNNPDASKRQSPILGSHIIHNFQWNGSALVKGKVYDPNNGKFYKGKIWYENGTLKMRGYVAMFYRTETWTKVKN